ncbi:hypothetical protein [Corallibacter vietnamensis]|uniref:Cyclophilin-like domain-containing protein n=1 Tax=Corallibacter vietnamensis TaxID=904130 RepID=A0ABP7GUV0_9FLAO
MKKGLIIISTLVIIGFLGFKLLGSLVINNTEKSSCVTETRTITKIEEATSYDITFETTSGQRYYINRGLERGLNLDSLNAKVLNKTVTLHLPKLWTGVSSHISQLAIGDTIIFTEFKNNNITED